MTSILSLPGSYAFAASDADGSASDSPGVLSGNTVQAPVDVPVNVCGNSVDVVGALNPAFGNSCSNGSQTATGTSATGSTAVGSTQNSPGVGSGNTVQAPVDVPVNACGNSVDVVGALNPVFGNGCANDAPVATTQQAPSQPSQPSGPTQPSQPSQPTQPSQPSGPTQPTQPSQPSQPSQPTQPSQPSQPTVPATGTTLPAPVTPPAQNAVTPAVDVGGSAVSSSVSREQTPADATLAATGTDQDLAAAAAASAGLLVAGGLLYRRGRVASRR
ncbi:chaplin family protein [Streptomyces sp. NPDC002004]